jgi:hypothetical protein
VSCVPSSADGEVFVSEAVMEVLVYLLKGSEGSGVGCHFKVAPYLRISDRALCATWREATGLC